MHEAFLAVVKKPMEERTDSAIADMVPWLKMHTLLFENLPTGI